MESHISPANIQERSEKLVTPEEKAPEVKAPEVKAPEAKAPEAKAPEVKASEAKAPEAKPGEVKLPDAKAPEIKDAPKTPNDPAELRKWATKASQENAALRDEIKAVKAAIEKMTKKPVDYKELAKNPELIQKQIETERQEAIAEMQQTLIEKTNLAVQNETIVEKMRREQDVENYPEWKRVFPLIQNLASNTDGRVNFNQKPGDVLDALYQLAIQLAPAAAPAAVVVPTPEVKAAVPVKTAEEIEAEITSRVEAAVKKAREDAAVGISGEQNGAGIGSAGKGGRRDNKVSKEALKDMPMKDLKKLISQE